MEFIKKDEIKAFVNPGVVSRQLLNSENSSSRRVTITQVTVEAGESQPRHSHDASEQIWICMDGEGCLLLADDKEQLFLPGDVVRFEYKDVHGIKNHTSKSLTYISVTCPPINFAYAYQPQK